MLSSHDSVTEVGMYVRSSSSGIFSGGERSPSGRFPDLRVSTFPILPSHQRPRCRLVAVLGILVSWVA